MNPSTILTILDLINKAIPVGGELLQVGLRALAALKSEGALTDEQFDTVNAQLNDQDKFKLEALIATLP